MNDATRAAEQLEQVIAARQMRQPLPAHEELDVAKRDRAVQLVDVAQATRIDPVFAAKLELRLNQLYATQPDAQATSRWQRWFNALTQHTSHSVGFAVLASLLLALASFAIFRALQSGAGQPLSATEVPPTVVPFILAVTPTVTATELAQTATAPPSSTPQVVVLPPATATPFPSATRTPILPSASPTRTPTRAPSATPQASPTSSASSRVKIFMLDVDGSTPGKQIGCGDTVVAVERNIAPTSSPLQSAIRELLSVHDQYYGQSGLFNALYRSTLQLDSATIVNGRATINLSGTIRVNGVCDNPRVIAQLQETALQFSAIKQVSIYVNGVDINTVLSQK